MKMPSELKKLEEFFVEKIKPILGVETVQILLIREVLDYTVLRTEETRELNTIVTPRSLEEESEEIERVVFLGSKQKAVETRYFRSLLNTAAQKHKIELDDCYMKDNLCLSCPRCTLFGAVKTAGKDPNIKHRINYSTAFSLLPFSEINSEFTFNAISDVTTKTGQALGTTYSVKPTSIFLSAISLRSSSWEEFVLVLKMLLATKDYGAETRVRGSIRNIPIAIIGGWEEVITPLELTIKLFDSSKETKVITSEMVDKTIVEYSKKAGFRDNITSITGDELETLLEKISSLEISKEFLESMFKASEDFKEEQKNRDTDS